jgi:hypothetical protein
MLLTKEIEIIKKKVTTRDGGDKKHHGAILGKPP